MSSSSVATKRASLIRGVLGDPPGRVWCPLLTPYRVSSEAVRVDADRLGRHMRSIEAFVGGLLIAGSTGDGWDMDDGQFGEVVEIAAGSADTPKMIALLGATTENVLARAKIVQGMVSGNAPAVAVCPPVGEEHNEEAIEMHYRMVLDTVPGPVALYELPQVTKNHITGRLLERLAGEYARVIMLKDTSGEDVIAGAGADYGGVFLVRGAEGHYATQLIEGGGRYNGLLLSTANTFGRQLAEIVALVEAGDRARAVAVSDRLTVLVDMLFDTVADVPFGNAFANANRAVDHLLAYGKRWADAEGPFAFDGQAIDRPVIGRIAELLRAQGLLPAAGYLGGA